MSTAPQSRFAGLRTLSGLVLIVLLLIATLHSAGIPQAIDASLQTTYYRLWGPSDSEQRVVLVQADEATAEQWGEPHWDESRRTALYDRIVQGGPAAVVVVDGSRMFRGQPSDDLVPDDVLYVDLGTHFDPGANGIDSIDGDDLPIQELAPVLDALDLPPLSSQNLRIHYQYPTSRLPSVTVQRVERGDVPASVFTDKVVVVGLTSRAHRDAMATPVGSLTSPEIVSHAMAMVTDGRQWFEPSGFHHALALLLVLIGCGLALWGTTPSQGLVRSAAIAGTLVLVDLTAFGSGLVYWGVAMDLLAVLGMMLGHWYLIQQRSAEIVDSVSTHVSSRLRDDLPGTPAPVEGFWQDMAELCRAYLTVDFNGVFAELPEGSWHLEYRAYVAMTADDVHERRRDVRRLPFRAALLTHKVTRTERRFVDDDNRYTMVVPLTHQGSVYGMWMMCLDVGTELDASEMSVIEALGAELGRSIAERRRGIEQGKPLALSSGNITARLSRLVRGVEALGDGKQQVVDTFESLPIGLLIADVWGQIIRVNGNLRERLGGEFPDGIPNNDLSAVLARLTGNNLEDVHKITRSVVRAGKTFRLRPTGDQRGPTYLLIPMRQRSVDERSGQSDATTRLVLMTGPSDLDQAVDVLMRSG